MAPIITSLMERYSRSRVHPGGGAGGGIGGGVIAAVIAVMIVVFICVYVHEYNKAKRVRDQTGAPIRNSKCLKKAFLIALTLGLVSLVCAECCGLDDSNNGDVGGGNVGGVPQMDQMGGAGFVQQPMPSYQPQMDMGPVQSAAMDPVLG